MKAPPFEYHQPKTLGDALHLLKEGDARILAGGQSLVPMLNFRLLAPGRLVDINRIEEMRMFSVAGGVIRIGAMIRQRELERSAELARVAPILQEAVRQIGHVQTRNRGTIGGSLCHLDPSAELPALALLHDAILVIASSEGSRKAPASAFIQGAMNPGLEPGEILTGIEFQAWPSGHGYGFLEYARRAGDFALGSVGVLVTADQGGRIERVAICVGGLGDRPVRLVEAERDLVGKAFDQDAATRAASSVSSLPVDGSVHASASYKRRIVETLVRRCLTSAWARVVMPGSTS